MPMTAIARAGTPAAWLTLLVVLGWLSAVPALADPADPKPAADTPPPTATEAPASTDPATPPEDIPGELRQLEEHFGLIAEGPEFDRVQRIAHRLIAALPTESQALIHAVKLLDDDTENAFAVPAGYVYVFKGLLAKMVTDDQLAGVLGHEMTHILKKHSELVNKDAWKYQLGGVLLAALTKEPALYTAAQVAGLNHMLTYSQKAEKEADRGGLELMSLAGFQPVGMLEFMSAMDDSTALDPMLHEGYFLTHPYPSERKVLIVDWMTAHGYNVPAQIYKSRVPVEVIEVDDDDDLTTPAPHLGLEVDGELVFTFGGDREATLDRASAVAAQLRAALEAGSLEYDFRMAIDPNDSTISRVVTSQYTVLELAPEDVTLSGTDSVTLAESTLAKIRHILWRTRVKSHI